MRKRAEELAATPFTSETEHARRASNFKRLAGGLRNAAKLEGSGTTALFGLDEHETRALLRCRGRARGNGRGEQEGRGDQQEPQRGAHPPEKELRAAVQANVAALTSVADRVALIGAVSSYDLRNPDYGYSGWLDDRFRDALAHLTYTLADPAKAATSPKALVDEAWAKFDGAKASLQTKHQAIIDVLTKQASV